MTVSAQAGTFSFGPQSAKGATPTNWYRHRALMVPFGVNDQTRLGDPEVGGIATPTFPYKSGYSASGQVVIQPRLESTIGWLLYALFGSVASAETSVGSGMYDHVFKLNPTDSTYVPWMGFRKHIPRMENSPTTDLGEVFKDGKILSSMLQLPNDGPINMSMDALACDFNLDEDPTAWTYANSFEDWQSVPVGCVTDGYIKLDGAELPVVAASFGFQNQPLDLRMERTYGSPVLDGITIVQRQMIFDLTVKWNNPDLYRAVLTGSSSGTGWTPAPKVGAFEVLTASSKNMPTETEPYSLKMAAPEAMLALNGPISLAGGQAVLMRFTGVALANASDYAVATLRNKQASYTWPT